MVFIFDAEFHGNPDFGPLAHFDPSVRACRLDEATIQHSQRGHPAVGLVKLCLHRLQVTWGSQTGDSNVTLNAG